MAKTRRRKTSEVEAGQAAAPQNAGDTTVATVDRERIARRAYELYLQRGGREGDPMADWLEAERELTQRGSKK